MQLTDWQGQEYGPGDIVLYAAMGGRCPNIIKAEVVDIWLTRRGENWSWERLPDDAEPEKDDELRVRVLPLAAARWEQHTPKTRYIDKRTGKGIDPFRGRKHVEDGTNLLFCARTNTVLDDHGHGTCCTKPGYRPGEAVYHSTYGGDGPTATYVKPVFKDYVEKIVVPVKPVTLSVTENITKIAA
jgi:hypothetical protein